MSSHHVVREGQEPALYIYEFNDENLPIIEQILEWNPTVFIHASQIGKAPLQAFHWDVVVGHVEVGFLNAETISEAALQDVLRKTHNHAVIIVKKFSSSMDDWLFLTNEFDVKIISCNRQWVYLQHFHKWLPKNTTIQIMNIHANDLSDDFQKIDSNLYEYLIAENGFISLDFRQAYWIGESI